MPETNPDMTPEMTIDELAAGAGVVVSTVRLYQHRGLLPSPTRRGRVGYYDDSHLGRLRLIARLQERGFSLAGIKELLDGMDRGETLRAILGLGDAPSTWMPEPPEPMSPSELAAHLPQVEFTPEMVARVVDLGLVDFPDDVDLSDGGRVVVRSPSFLRIGSELASMGVPPDVILDEYEALRAETSTIAGRFTDVFRAHMWEPFVETGMPAARVTELVGSLERLGPLAEAVVVMALRQSLQDVAERFVRDEAARLDVDIPQPGHGAAAAPQRSGAL
jgi:DNA-binding transcriptional MerR regulator